MWAESESTAAVSSPAPGGLLKLHRDKQPSSVVFQEVRWAKRKRRAKDTQQEDGKSRRGGGVRGMEKAQHSSTQRPDKNAALGGRGAGSTDNVMFWLSASLAERSRDKDANRTRRGANNRLRGLAPNLGQNLLFLSACSRRTVFPKSHRLKSDPQSHGIWSGGLGKLLGHEGGALGNGISVLIREGPPPHEHHRSLHHLRTRKRALTRHGFSWCLDLGLLCLQKSEKYILPKPPSLWYFVTSAQMESDSA